MQRKVSSIPFVGLHAHSVASVFDGLGYPQAHMDFAYENGMDALALTDHGNMNGLAYQVLHAKKMEQDGKDFKPIFGVEAYFIPSIKEWRSEYERIKKEKAASKKKSAKLDDDVSGATVEDEQETKKAIKSILNKRRHLILLAQNQEGLNNIFTLISKSYREGNYYRFPRIDYDMLQEHSSGVIAASACLGGVYAGDFWENRDSGPDAVRDAMRTTTSKMVDIFGDRWYAELQWNRIDEQHQLNKHIIEIAKEFDLKMISTADSHYPNPQSWKQREVYRQLGWIGKGTENSELPEDIDGMAYQLYPKNGDEMWESYKSYSKDCGYEYDDNLVRDSIAETHNIAHERISRFLPDNTVRLPSFVVPEGKTPADALVECATAGLKSAGLNKRSAYVERLTEELEVININDFSQYFLTMKAIADIASDRQLVGPARGSAAGSLVAYVLGITQVDPLKYDLLFERFMTRNQKDAGFPDIDYDVSDPMVLKEVLIEEWGEDKVVPISNWNTLQLKSLIKDISKMQGIPFKEVNIVTSVMMKEATPLAKKAKGMSAGMYIPTFEEVKEHSPTLQDFFRKYPAAATDIDALYGQIRSCSRHAGGVVVGDNLDRHMPIINSGGVKQTPWSEGQNVRHLEPMGFIKFDILGLASLRMMESAITHILKRHHNNPDPSFSDVKDFYEKNLHPNVIDLDDQKVYKGVFQKGRWAGIFQFTEGGAQRFCKQVKPKNIVDLSAITSIYRPGPLSAKVDKNYISAKKSPDNIKYEHKIVKEITKETYGFMIFQEQIALLAHRLGKDLSLDEGNMLRKILTKKGSQKDKLKTKIHDKFITGCLEKDIHADKAQKLWDNFEYFSGYGFNKSHALSYSILSFQCAWLLNYYPSEWMAAFLDKEPEARKEKAINIARSMGFGIRKLDINTSGFTWEISEDGKTLIQPLSSVKGLGDAAIKEIVEHRPFKTVEDFLFNERMSYSKVNKKSIDALVRSQAMNELVDERFTGLKHFWMAIASDRPRKEKNLKENIEKFAPEGDFTAEEKLENLIDLTGLFPFDLVMTKEVERRLEEVAVPPISEFDEGLGVVWFIPRKVIPKKTKHGKDWWLVEAIDKNSESAAIKCWGVQKDKDVIHTNHPYMAKLDYDPVWGFSTRSIRRYFKLLG
jgi:DNA polymerase III subunit alpha